MSAASFYEAIRRLVSMIPAGQVASYGQIAAYLGHPRHARIVGWALHDLPGNTLVPWHRVVNIHGRITTSCLTHPANLQRLLLEEEGVVFDADEYIDMNRFRWEGPSDEVLRELMLPLPNPQDGEA